VILHCSVDVKDVYNSWALKQGRVRHVAKSEGCFKVRLWLCHEERKDYAKGGKGGKGGKLHFVSLYKIKSRLLNSSRSLSYNVLLMQCL
jgi:hypothetical protein